MQRQDAASSFVGSRLKLWCLLYFSHWCLLSSEFVPANAKSQNLRMKMIFIRDLPPNAAPKEHLTSWLHKGLNVLACKNAFEIRWWAVCQFTQKKIIHHSLLDSKNYDIFRAVVMHVMAWQPLHLFMCHLRCRVPWAEKTEAPTPLIVLTEVWDCLVYKRHKRPANCVSLHSID